jgi:hypothetical protein
VQPVVELLALDPVPWGERGLANLVVHEPVVVVELCTAVDLWRDVSSPRWDLKQQWHVHPES